MCLAERGQFEMLLSICIPNRNQAVAMEFSLKYFSDNLNELPQDVELLISDNFSTDNSLAVIREFSNDLDFKYFAQNTDLGFSGHLRFLAQKASGLYVIFLGAGDLIDMSSLKFLVNMLKMHKFSIITFEAAQPPVAKFPEKSLVKPTFISSTDDYSIPFFSTSISCNIFEKQHFVQALTRISHLRNEWPHLQIALNFAENQLERAYSSNRILQVHPTDSGWGHSAFAFDVLIQYEIIMREFVSRVPESAITYLPNIGINTIKLNRITSLKLSGVSPSIQQSHQMILTYRKISLIFLLLVLVLISPVTLLRVIHSTAKRFRKLLARFTYFGLDS
jgi:glycosyltransferase involved in cell wall biosynthesis